MAFMKDGNLLFTTDKSKQSVKQEYSNMIFRVMEAFAGSLVTNIEGYKDNRPDMYVQFLLNMILDEPTKIKLKQNRKKAIAEVSKKHKDAYEVDKECYEINMDYFGEFLAVCDNWIGIVKKQVILEIGPDGKEIK